MMPIVQALPRDAAEPTPPSLPPTAIEILRAEVSAPPQITYPTPWPGLDSLLGGGIRTRQLTLLIAPPGAGKTAASLQLAREALALRVPLLFIEMELEPAEVGARLAAPLMGATVDAIMRHETSPADAAHALQRAQDDAEAWPVYVRDFDACDTLDVLGAIRADVEAIATAHGRAPVVVVDYLQLMATGDADNMRLSVARIGTGLRKLARSANVAVVAISSTSRANYQRKSGADAEDPRTWLAAAKESGELDFAAATIVFLETAVGQADAEGTCPGRFIVPKSRRGRVGFVGIRFRGVEGRVVEHSAALTEMGSGARGEREDRAVLDAVKSLARLPGGVVLRELRQRVPNVAQGRVKASVERLLEAGTIAERDLVRRNAAGRQRAVRVLVPVGTTEDAARSDD